MDEAFFCPYRKFAIVTLRYAHFAEKREEIRKQYEEMGIKLLYKKHFVHVPDSVTIRGLRCLKFIELHDAHLVHVKSPDLMILMDLYSGTHKCKECLEQERYELILNEQKRYDPICKIIK